MKSDDFHVIACRILSYLYACMRAGEAPNVADISYEALNIPQRYWNDIMSELKDNGYIKGISEVRVMGSSPGIKAIDPKITMQGIAFLQENSLMHKAYEFLKSLKEIIPGI